MSARGRQRGVSLLEVLIALLLLALGFLATARMQVEALRSSANSEYAWLAAGAANDIAAQMWDRASVNLPAADVTAWQTRVADVSISGLPNAAGTVGVATPQVARVTVTWRHPRLPAGSESRFVTDVVVSGP